MPEPSVASELSPTKSSVSWRESCRLGETAPLSVEVYFRLSLSGALLKRAYKREMVTYIDLFCRHSRYRAERHASRTCIEFLQNIGSIVGNVAVVVRVRILEKSYKLRLGVPAIQTAEAEYSCNPPAHPFTRQLTLPVFLNCTEGGSAGDCFQCRSCKITYSAQIRNIWFSLGRTER
jgi:hypothetical protein